MFGSTRWGRLYLSTSGYLSVYPADGWLAINPDDYNAVAVRCVGRRVTTTVNGKVVTDGEFDLPDGNRIGWHVGAGSVLQVNDIQFTELSKPAAPPP